MNEMNITAARYAPAHPITGEASQSVIATIDGVELHIPSDTANRHHQAILDWVADGNTIQDAD